MAAFNGHQNSTFYVKSSISPDDQFLVSGSSDEAAYIWKVLPNFSLLYQMLAKIAFCLLIHKLHPNCDKCIMFHSIHFQNLNTYHPADLIDYEEVENSED